MGDNLFRVSLENERNRFDKVQPIYVIRETKEDVVRLLHNQLTTGYIVTHIVHLGHAVSGCIYKK